MNIQILLATYQGERYLKDQLDSILSQTYKNWTLLISDDGSSDNTLAIIEKFKRTCHQTVHVISGPRKGATKNFFHLINSASKENGVLYAFCDQDDVWYTNKLLRAVENYRVQIFSSSDQAYLYCGRTEIVSETLSHLGFGPIPKKALGFGNALLQNIAGGNTMIFNSAVLKTLQKINHEYSVLHDWTTYQVATGMGGIVFFDHQPMIAYRQHEKNVVGAATGALSRFKQLKVVLSSQHMVWALQTLKTMLGVSECLTSEASKRLAIFNLVIHHPNFWRRVEPFIRKIFWHQTIVGTIAYIALVLFIRGNHPKYSITQ